jgi:hypothetical protein
MRRALAAALATLGTTAGLLSASAGTAAAAPANDSRLAIIDIDVLCEDDSENEVVSLLGLLHLELCL